MELLLNILGGKLKTRERIEVVILIRTETDH